jgi:transposase
LHNDVGSIDRVDWFALNKTKAREGANVMLIIGCDFHPSFQLVSIFDNQSGEVKQMRLGHRAEAEAFYRSLASPALVGMEACGHYPWFERLLAECGHELWLGDASQIRASDVRKQKTDRRDADHILTLLRENRFPRIWVPTLAERDLRQLLVHRHKQVQARTRVKNQLQAMALSHGIQRKGKLWTGAGRTLLEQLPLERYGAQRRGQLLSALDRFADARKLASYVGLIPSEHSSGGRQRFGHISKQGNAFLRFLLVEAGQSAVRGDEELGRYYRRLSLRKHRALAKVAVARKLATRLYWMLRANQNYAQLRKARYAGEPESFCGRR